MSIDRNIVIKLQKKFSKIIFSMSIDRNIVINLHKSGESNSEIAKRLKMNRTIVWNSVVQLRARRNWICAARGTILHKSCRLQAAATFFLKNAMILGRK